MPSVGRRPGTRLHPRGPRRRRSPRRRCRKSCAAQARARPRAPPAPAASVSARWRERKKEVRSRRVEREKKSRRTKVEAHTGLSRASFTASHSSPASSSQRDTKSNRNSPVPTTDRGATVEAAAQSFVLFSSLLEEFFHTQVSNQRGNDGCFKRTLEQKGGTETFQRHLTRRVPLCPEHPSHSRSNPTRLEHVLLPSVSKTRDRSPHVTSSPGA